MKILEKDEGYFTVYELIENSFIPLNTYHIYKNEESVSDTIEKANSGDTYYGMFAIKKKIKDVTLEKGQFVEVHFGATMIFYTNEIISNDSINLIKTNSIISNNNRNRITAEDEEYIYFTNSFSVKKIKKKDNTVETIFELEDFADQIIEIECFEDKLYFLTFTNRLLIISKDDTEKTIQLDYAAPSFYTYGDKLYLFDNDTSDVSEIKSEELTLEKADSAIVNQYITMDGTMFIKKIEDNLGKVYVVKDGEEELFTGENESVILNRMNFTESYVFYYAFDMERVEEFSALTAFKLYRVDLNGENKKLIREIELYENNGNIRYDNEYIYVNISAEEYLKIHKETLEETNIIDQINIFGLEGEVSNGRFFNYTGTSFWDSAIGEEIEF